MTLLLGYLIAAYAVVTGLVGNAQKRVRLVQSSVNALYAYSGLMLLASALMIYAFITHDYTIRYVYHYSDTSMPLSYKITAYWGGLNGSMLFWVFVLGMFSAVAVAMNRKRHRDMIGFVVGTIMVVQLFFLSILIFAKNPFDTFLTGPPIDGRGLNPALQNYWMVIHPPSLYIGFVAATIPFAFGIAALASGRLDDRWIKSIRSWTMICWFFLSLGLILGCRWAYEELGWGGYWAWDPVENAGLIPWFTATAFLHSAIIQEQRGTMKIWNLMLVIVTFWFTIFGTFMTRSGIVQSVHAFGEDSQLALLFILFLVFILIVSFGLLIFRIPKLRSRSSFESFISREYAFLLNNWILLGCAFFVLFATMFPTISEAVNGQRIIVGPKFFDKWMTPLGLALLFLAGAAPLLAWRRTTRSRLWSQFAFPTAVSVLTAGLISALMPRALVTTPIMIFGKHMAIQVEMYITLINFALIAFVIASIGQEFWRGTRVRMRQTGGGFMTSLVGITLRKRRKFGGYIIHMAIAVMFFGFAGKAYETQKDRSVQGPLESFTVKGYTFVYEDLVFKADDHKEATTAHVSLYKNVGPDFKNKLAAERRTVATLQRKLAAVSHKVGQSKTALARKTAQAQMLRVEDEIKDASAWRSDKLKLLTPARWKYRKFDEPSTEVSMSNHIDEDVYMVLTGFQPQNKVAHFRVYINPLVNWLWIGFAFLFLGTVLCLIPQKWVDNLGPGPRSRAGRFSQAAIFVLAVGSIVFGLVRVAHAQTPGGGVEHQARPTHYDGIGNAHICRPEQFEQDPELASRLMHELVCMCGGCQRESLYECKCGFARQDRCKVLQYLREYQATKPNGTSPYDFVISKFVEEYGERVLSTPKSSLSWLLPFAGIAGGLVLLFAMGRRWVRRGKTQMGTLGESATTSEADEEYADRLDDELRETD